MKPIVKQKLSTLQDIINKSLISQTLPLTLITSSSFSFPVHKLSPGKYLLLLFTTRSIGSIFQLNYVEWTGNPTTSYLSFNGTALLATSSFDVVDNKNVIIYKTNITLTDVTHAIVINCK